MIGLFDNGNTSKHAIKTPAAHHAATAAPDADARNKEDAISDFIRKTQLYLDLLDCAAILAARRVDN